MKKSLPWHFTPAGRIVLWLGSIQLAVPVLVLVAIALGVGTFLESTRGVRVARQHVYGSWWFIAVMGLVCVSLIFAVITRFPWKRRHIGFITVHASLVALIAAGFWSMFARVEGRLALEENTLGDVIETDQEQIEILAHQSGGFNSLADGPAPERPASLALGGVKVQVLERWANSHEEDIIADDSPVPLRAVDISPDAGPRSAWVGQEDQAGPAPVLLGLKVLVLPEGSPWQPPPPPATPVKGSFVFVVGTERFPVTGVGQDVFPGWNITELTRFERALVSGDGVVEGPPGTPPNSAIRVKIADGRGTVEQHTAFESFPDIIMGKPLEGTGNSASQLVAGSARGEPETLVVFGTVAATKIGYVGPDGRGKVIDPPPTYPMQLSLGPREVTIHRQLARAHQTRRVHEAPPAKDNRPALLVRVGDDTALQTVVWKGMVPVPSADKGTLMLHFGPRRVQLPFTVRLADFRKTDYPGTDMAMAYESDVGITAPGTAEVPFQIYMNHPYVHGPWKVYQSGFVGETLSIFSVMHDPGLPLTYGASVMLCVGVLVTFYSRSLSWGHPGIPVRAVEVEASHAASREVGSSAGADVLPDDAVVEVVGGARA